MWFVALFTLIGMGIGSLWGAIIGTKIYFQKYQPTTIVKSYRHQFTYVRDGMQVGSFWGTIFGFLYGWWLFALLPTIWHGILLGIFGFHSFFPLLFLLNDYATQKDISTQQFFDSNYKKWNLKRKLLETLSNCYFDYGFFHFISLFLFACVGIVTILYMKLITSF